MREGSSTHAFAVSSVVQARVAQAPISGKTKLRHIAWRWCSCGELGAITNMEQDAAADSYDWFSASEPVTVDLPADQHSS